MTRSEFVFDNIKSSDDFNACAILWLEENGWYRPSLSNDGTRQPNFGKIERVGQALSGGVEMRFTNGSDNIDVGFDCERDEIVFRHDDGTVLNAAEFIRSMAEVDDMLNFALEKLDLNAWGFRPSEKEKTGKPEKRGFHLAQTLKKYYTVFRRWKRKVDAATDDFQLCRWDFENNKYRVADANWVHEACKDIIPDTPSKVANEAYKHLFNDKNIPIVTEPYTDCLPAANGDFHVLSDRDGIMEPTPEHFVISRIKAEWRGEVHHPAVDAIFNGIENEMDRQGVKIYMGYALTPKCDLRKMLLLYGNPRSGKSTLCNAFIRGVIGMDNIKVFSLNQDFGDGDSSRFGLQGWEGASLAYCDEIGSGRIPDSGPLKSIAAGEPVSIDRKGKAKVSVTLTPKIIMCTNHIPNFQDTSSAVLDRLIPIDMCREQFTCGALDQSVFDEPEFGSAMLWEIVQAVRSFAKHDENRDRWYLTGEIPVSEKSEKLLGLAAAKSNPIIPVFKQWYEEDGENIIGQSWSKFLDGRFKEMYKGIHAIEPDMKKTGQTTTVSGILQNTVIQNPDTGNEERFQIVSGYKYRDSNGASRTISGFVARFSHNADKNRNFVKAAAAVAIALRDGNSVGVILKMSPSANYNSELVL